jgi:hypothetical protein
MPVKHEHAKHFSRASQKFYNSLRPPIDFYRARKSYWSWKNGPNDQEFIQLTNKKQGGPPSNLAANSNKYISSLSYVFAVNRMGNGKHAAHQRLIFEVQKPV